ncbi:hypothetical protein [Sandaracinobacteroides saxicola]|uniref:Uncharacterized protein n=1 Tax=Sandaracinobacteroides saxicola TaxID=2759707 RepID=A0A7G5ILN1_9SPHN|nr:hypothetical protein [Sandaracinobacteroides saxicola]QMW24273.1 hypothetical protein H3309_07420 [Sandaracinobacteroides saxicola]
MAGPRHWEEHVGRAIACSVIGIAVVPILFGVAIAVANALDGPIVGPAARWTPNGLPFLFIIFGWWFGLPFAIPTLSLASAALTPWSARGLVRATMVVLAGVAVSSVGLSAWLNGNLSAAAVLSFAIFAASYAIGCYAVLLLRAWRTR